MAIGDDELHPAQTTPRQLAQKSGPEGLRFGGTDIHAQNLTPTVAVDADGDDDRHRDDPAGLAHLHIGRVDPQIGPVALDRPVEEGLDPFVDLFAEPRDLALGDAAHPHRLDQIVDRAGRDALDVGLLDHGGERLLGHPPRLQEAREVGALPQPGDAQLDRAGARLPVALAIAVALRQTLRALLPEGRAGQPADLQLHQALGGKADHLAQQIRIRALLQQPAQGHHLVGHRGSLGSGLDLATQT